MQCCSLCFHVFLFKVALSKVLDPDIEMNEKSGADTPTLLRITITLPNHYTKKLWYLIEKCIVYNPPEILKLKINKK